ncbi:leucine-rich repeat receptor-like tyrosine-protein kinase-like [Dorcoceras hygrometricum]|uniref:Leucine-rich repeat receptor-like tyrosine-protein kinase-like n=1 Tax=Dorcoceras hygrometricum TaxID=472368 RepID=A0A2Z7BLV3_9LAMI|nr:leucine-rich repeat receptor-like tyrosine-protein kinase-like [Dorcoceras hygrometricum]
MGRCVYYAAVTLFVFLLYLRLVLSSQLSSDQANIMTQVYEIFQYSTGSSFVWKGVRKDSSPCSWRGVSCSNDNSSTVGLSFQFLSISTSEFLPLLCKIDTLVSLDVSNNQLSSIPDGFFTLCGGIRGLKLLNFSGNKLVGHLPAFNGFKAVEFLDFSDNLFSGKIGLELVEMDSLRSLNLSRNMFVGSIPTSLGKLNLLEELQLSFNSFSGEIPAQLTKYSNLKLIDLRNNNISGSIPEEMGGLAKLEILILSLNSLTGGIPTSLSNITTFQRFAANQNNFNGTVPSGLTFYLKNLDLSYNSLKGTIPSDILSGPNLESLDLSHNELEGLIPGNLSRKLFRLRLGSNFLKGIIPVGSLGNLVELTYLELDNNSLVGTIPSELATCRNLSLLNLAQNQLTGPLPPALGNLTNLRALYLQFNYFVGEIPAQITQLHKLQRLNLSRNSLNGVIPSSISRLGDLERLDLQGNNLSGSIPNSIGSLTSLIELQLGKNHLSGLIPQVPQGLQIALNLSYNHFEGPIPRTLFSTSLEVLDLSHNRFSGNIPDFLTLMTSLTLLVLSDNQLYGVVPKFGPFVVLEIERNYGLIENVGTPSSQPPNKRKSLSSEIVMSIAAAATAVGLLIMIALFISRRYYRIIDEYVHSEEEISPSEIILGKFLTPNSIHRSNIDFRKAMEDVTDPCNVTLKTRFCTYYKVVMPSSNRYFVKKLNWSDKILQSGSHHRFGEELKVIGTFCNSNVMIPLAYVLRGDGAYLFYDFTPMGTLSDVLHNSMGTTLGWVNRYRIAIGMAQGLAFLHGCNSGPILLLDLSSKSIHLKSLNEPQIGDIELCKVIDPSKSTSSLSAVAGSVGYIAPEYAYTMRVTEAGNVYSYGVVLLELLTGKPAVCEGTELAKWVLCNSVQQDNWDKILDMKVSETSPDSRNQMLAVLKVALSCISISPGARPKTRSVLRMLLNAR